MKRAYECQTSTNIIFCASRRRGNISNAVRYNILKHPVLITAVSKQGREPSMSHKLEHAPRHEN